VDKLEQIKRLYFRARPETIERDIARAIELLKSMDSDEERDKAAFFMDGLSQMRSEWAGSPRKTRGPS
jgi:hypothetical protein